MSIKEDQDEQEHEAEREEQARDHGAPLLLGRQRRASGTAHSIVEAKEAWQQAKAKVYAVVAVVVGVVAIGRNRARRLAAHALKLLL